MRSSRRQASRKCRRPSALRPSREQAIARMRIALSEMVVEGIKTNIPLHRELMIDSKFVEGGTSIHYLEHRLAQKQQVAPEEA